MSISHSNIAHKEAALVPNGDIAARVKAAREAVGYSIEDLAVTCGLAVVEINDIENGTDFSPAKLKRVAGALQVPVSHFLPTEM
ncbi:helix-turn-helix domain-containing protein [Sinorhizobium medicae]|uniref:Helix-turn-helix domain-containing protein n=2 Tax=Sinorhizobium medicae TaxID=110321 RepID=A0A6G1WJM0_9HYPH|nr:helix-turn-helix transcriptional regulator [Sinorhizobium medicae]ABR63716.1 transcriptional regulator, XRE family [Sinorhizobium medicae WSM419]MBO1941979.1 helix-turn-helix transcriptional regulator [Sinorhizobium medicae]MDX0425553.1 helix-turn-helix domain-containing protein [Sinorhizobium medicae]MDX0432552.1 helix-turn-helix domain-containing protein [Sinorhizobium medicae]MDX0444282.1 helix-turn-helix domain-containing protein [Sinorhizobium medicae]